MLGWPKKTLGGVFTDVLTVNRLMEILKFWIFPKSRTHRNVSNSNRAIVMV